MMEESPCKSLLQSFPLISEAEDLYSTQIANCVLNGFLTYPCVMLNIVTIQALRKTSPLPKTLRTLLLSLAFSDVCVGLLVQPLYLVLLVGWLQKDMPGCGVLQTFIFLLSLFAHISFYLLVAISVDRFLAVHLHLRYQELVTHKRVVIIVIFIPLLSAFVSSMPFWVSLNIYYFYMNIDAFMGISITTVAYVRVYVAVRHHKNQIQAQSVESRTFSGEALAGAIKTVVGVFYLYMFFLLCFLPFTILLACIRVIGPGIRMKKLYFFSVTSILLNSFLNPLIYCWKMRHIRRTVIDIMRSMSWKRIHVPRDHQLRPAN